MAEPRPFSARLVSRALHLWWRFSRGMTLGVRAVVIDAAGSVLLVRHSYTPGWHLPGGGVEPGETLLDALAKELAEEANIVMEAEPEFIGLYFNDVVSARDHVGVFVVRHFQQTGPRLPDREIREARFFPAGSLPEGVTPGTRRRIAEALGEASPASRW